MRKVERTEAEWRGLLTKEQYHILRERGTEPPFSHAGFPSIRSAPDSPLRCAGCAAPLFRPADMFDAGVGWPCFSRPIAPNALDERPDRRFSMARREIACACCGGHLGHVFDDGSVETGRRFCVNGLALDHASDAEAEVALDGAPAAAHLPQAK